MDQVAPDSLLLGPFPALTPAQRYHFDVFGYVLIENTLTGDEIETLREVLQRLRRELLAGRQLPHMVVHRALEHMTIVTRLHGYDPAIVDYLAKPWLVGMAEEICGGSVRLSASLAIVNRRDPADVGEGTPAYDFHVGVQPGWATWTTNGLFHTSLVRTFTTLNDLGPDDGGTVLIPGSHKIDIPQEAVIAAAYGDPALIHQFSAPAGSTMLFAESLLHATGRVRGDRERMVISGMYAPTWSQAYNSHRNIQETPEEVVASVPERLRPLLSGSHGFSRTKRYRSLEMPADSEANARSVAGMRASG